MINSKELLQKGCCSFKRIVELTQAGVMTLDSAVNTVIAEFTEVDPSEEKRMRILMMKRSILLMM